MAPTERELESQRWIYPWRLKNGAETPVANAELPSIHRTRAELIEPAVRQVLEAAGPDASALDLACNEGWFSHRLRDWGARRVVGIDIRRKNLERATLMREYYDIPVSEMEFRQADVFGLDPSSLGTFDVVLLLGLIYHVENPMGVIRFARACTGRLCAIESQLTRQTQPVVHGLGQTGQLHESPGSFAIQVERGDNSLASTGNVLSLLPNRAALELMAHSAGFSSVTFAVPRPEHNPQYVSGDRAVLLASC
jgi:tRNA (mo5U34)-methyltransferase